MLVAFLLLNFAGSSEQIRPNRSFDEFPLKIGDWRGEKGAFDAQVYDVLGVDDYILANYASPGKEPVSLYVGFYQSQKEGDLIHSPKNCMPGSGWNITQTSIETINVNETISAGETISTSENINASETVSTSDNAGTDKAHIDKTHIDRTGKEKQIKAIKLLLQKGSQKQVVLYWFQSRGRNIASEYMQKIWLVIDSITRHRTDGSFVRYIAPVVQSEEQTLSVMKGFIRKTYPLLNEFIPS